MIDRDRSLVYTGYKAAMQLTLNEKAYLHIRDGIASGKLSPGDRLTTRILATEIGVSLAPVREAINRLATEGLVSHTPGAGAFVRQPSIRDLEELYVLRQATESFAAREAAKYISTEQLETMESLVRAGYSIADEIRALPTQQATDELANRWCNLEEQFHGVLVEASRNQLLRKVIEEHRAIGRIFDVHRQFRQMITLDGVQETALSHEQLVRALRARSPVTAQRLMSEHIERHQSVIVAQFRNSQLGVAAAP